MFLVEITIFGSYNLLYEGKKYHVSKISDFLAVAYFLLMFMLFLISVCNRPSKNFRKKVPKFHQENSSIGELSEEEDDTVPQKAHNFLYEGLR